MAKSVFAVLSIAALLVFPLGCGQQEPSTPTTLEEEVVAPESSEAMPAEGAEMEAMEEGAEMEAMEEGAEMEAMEGSEMKPMEDSEMEHMEGSEAKPTEGSPAE